MRFLSLCVSLCAAALLLAAPAAGQTVYYDSQLHAFAGHAAPIGNGDVFGAAYDGGLTVGVGGAFPFRDVARIQGSLTYSQLSMGDPATVLRQQSVLGSGLGAEFAESGPYQALTLETGALFLADPRAIITPQIQLAIVQRIESTERLVATSEDLEFEKAGGTQYLAGLQAGLGLRVYPDRRIGAFIEAVAQGLSSGAHTVSARGGLVLGM